MRKRESISTAVPPAEYACHIASAALYSPRVSSGGYELVRLRNGAYSVRSQDHGETMHPGLGPVAEAEALYVQQLRLAERLRALQGEFVIWDVGLGAAANALVVLRATRESAGCARLLSFDETLEPLRFAFGERSALGYFAGYEPAVERLLSERRAEFQNGRLGVRWECRVTDFPALLGQSDARALPKPHAILFDPWSPTRNPAMWTAPLFERLFGLLDPARPCAMPTYSRSTMTRVALLLAGFWVGAGRAAGRKEQTTIAANAPGLIDELLDRRWLERARRSPGAEPLWEPAYRQAPLTPETWARLQQHPQFK
jgi:tRNA U34 5-methylaminomethyl-2-thiouridine-forming methyltransferase MnmC